jgi:hypothetical protein
MTINTAQITIFKATAKRCPWCTAEESAECWCKSGQAKKYREIWESKKEGKKCIQENSI